MLKKFLATVSVVGLVAGAANALEVVPQVVGAPAVGAPVALAAELDYDGGAVETSGVHNQLRFAFHPTGGVFPTGNVVMRIEVTGAEFSSALDGSEVTTVAGTSVVSTGGVSGGSVVNILLSDVSACNATFNCFVDLPLTLTSGNVSVDVGLETDAGVDVDNSSLTNLVSAQLAVAAPAFAISIDADTGPTVAELDDVDPFVNLIGDRILGLIAVDQNSVDVLPGAGVLLADVKVDLLGTDVDMAADVDSITVVVAGDMDPFTPNAPAGNFFFDPVGPAAAVPATVSAAARTATLEVADGPIEWEAVVAEDGVTQIDRSTYIATVTVEVAAGSNLTAGATSTAPIQSITREGTEVTFPWTQSATQGEASGATSVFRVGNLSDIETGSVFVEVRNSSEAGYTNPGVTQVADSIEAGGEFVINSAQLEAAVGNYGRGDVNFIIEADSDTLTGRQFVVRNGNVQQVSGGTISQDLN